MEKSEVGSRKSELTAMGPQERSASESTSDFRLPTSDLQKPPLTDSPLFWLALFGIFALVAMLVLGPKYALRQGGIETRFQNRQVAGQWQGEATQSADAVNAARLPTRPEERTLLIPLAPLFVVLGVVVVAMIAGLAWRKNKYP